MNQHQKQKALSYIYASTLLPKSSNIFFCPLVLLGINQ